mmetsp:Transcript_75162/g.125331  ORF Transcript_75162/g.125331 Transcript_75162/m.125331 type:complete len:183 (-) Transcript_75162:656-1204(-)|eukprot:CAMPEP_0119346818 /NCGR_PEP_ID=MMETSP1333-20130426/108201_1 /TAXON_ID=418940 /ORGANISM="Scyphosphaera apsteinii, Strain RCC1455" /LENGTH=182 /DNA_ID=CAMNT_0007359339 /DNA_START=213 /DNA_END=761 /DNA_ORIENTATION=+
MQQATKKKAVKGAPQSKVNMLAKPVGKSDRAAKGEAPWRKYLKADDKNPNEVLFRCEDNTFDWECTGLNCDETARASHVGRCKKRKNLCQSVKQHFEAKHREWFEECFPNSAEVFDVDANDIFVQMYEHNVGTSIATRNAFWSNYKEHVATANKQKPKSLTANVKAKAGNVPRELKNLEIQR